MGLSPGGIAEMFVPTTHPNEEYALLARRKGFIRISIKHQVPIVPIYVFGGTKMFHRLSLPNIFEYLSKSSGYTTFLLVPSSIPLNGLEIFR